MTRALVVGVDGGNSKTDLVLATTTGRILAQIRGGGTRSHQDGIPAMVDGLTDLVRQALRRARLSPGTPILAGAYFLANVDQPDHEQQVHAEIARHRLSELIVVRNDTLAVLAAGSPTGWGIAAVAGAGVNAVGVDPAGRHARFLSLGELSGDWGGGYHVGLAGLAAAIRAGDGRGRGTVLRELLAAHYDLPSVEDVALAMAAHRLPQSSLHQVAPIVFAAAEQADPVAGQITEQLADELVTLVTALAGRLELTGHPVPVILGGGTLQHGPGLLLRRISTRVTAAIPDADVHVLKARPVAGALLEALALAGAGPARDPILAQLAAAGESSPAPSGSAAASPDWNLGSAS